ncbi:hypothetical protein [Siphonobacter sp. SORGH_AS_0500]|uniref:hypothetical protein n=1 Tax=Siphonobacter sp. SORGH_AS_0500 TaxID=1864824 RepID=UPI00285E4EF2|nr:hypothetical protein [Siphonobacter sp. SORGH_AS_0500]MDR6193094.1 hypothetical protein [Siphonobacter sp. SORGH_AS_0500]
MNTSKVNNNGDDFKSFSTNETYVTNFNDLTPEAIFQKCERASALVGQVINGCSYETAAQISALFRENMLLNRKMEEVRKQLCMISGVHENDWLRFLQGLDWMKIQGIPIPDRVSIATKNLENEYLNDKTE